MSDNFPNLWASFRAQVQAARGEREAIYTYADSPFGSTFGGRVSIEGHPDAFDTPYANIHVTRNAWSGVLAAHQSDLVAIAAQCMAVAEQMGELPIAEGFNAGAHGHLLTERAPVDDEHNN